MSFEEILVHPLMALFVTIGSYVAAENIQKKCNNHALLNPVVIAILVCVLYIVATGLSYEEYLSRVNLIHLLLGPATVALAIPLYHQLALIKKSAFAIGLAVMVCCLVAPIISYTIAHIMDAPRDLQLSIIPKSATTAIAIGIAEKIHAAPSLAVFFVITTGMIGSLFAIPFLKFCRIKDDKAIGLALGVACHGLGTARAIQHSETAGAFAAVGMSIMGIACGILLPVLVMWILS